MKKILIVGGCGYIGSALYSHLQQTNHVDTVDLEWFGNYNNPNNFKQDFDSLSIEFIAGYDIVILTAAHSSVKLCEHLYDAFDNNVIKFIRLVSKLRGQKFIYASSACVYGTSDARPKSETELIKPLDGLTLTKNTIDDYMLLSNVEFYGLRFGSVNGWSPNFRLDLMINSMTISATKNKQVIVSNGHAYRPIIDMQDLCRAVDTVIENKTDNRGIYNVASYNENILKIGTDVANYFGVPLVDKGINFTYDFSISSQKFIDTFEFSFQGNTNTIIESIISNPYNINWTHRNEIYKK